MRWESASIRVPDKALLTMAEVASAIGYSTKHVRRWIQEGKFPPGKAVAGGQVRWSNMAIGVWLAWQDYGPASTVVEHLPDDEPEPDEPTPKSRRDKQGN